MNIIRISPSFRSSTSISDFETLFIPPFLGDLSMSIILHEEHLPLVLLQVMALHPKRHEDVPSSSSPSSRLMLRVVSTVLLLIGSGWLFGALLPVLSLN